MDWRSRVGDNAVVIALAVRTLPPKQRLRGILLGAGVAVVLRVSLTFIAAAWPEQGTAQA
jgi:predicted tellurium resistance membrane protein TerC